MPQMHAGADVVDKMSFKSPTEGFLGGLGVKNLLASAEDTGSIPGLGKLYMPTSN